MKRYFLFFLSLFFLLGFTFAEETIQNVSLKFCNDGLDNLKKDYIVKLDQGKKQDLCIYVENKSSNPVKIKYSFPSGKLNEQGNQICNPGEDFSKFFVDNPKREAVVSGNSSIILKEVMLAPVGIMGMQYGCIAYQFSEPEVKSMGGLFNMEVRKVAYINLFVGSEAFIENKVSFVPGVGGLFSSNKNIKASINEDGDLILNFAVKNDGNLEQEIVLQGKLYNPLGFEKDFTLSGGRLAIGQTYEGSVNLGVIPFYKGLFSVRTTLTATPYFGFAESLVDARYKQPVVVKETSTLFIFSRTYVVILLVILALIALIVVPKKRKVEEHIQIQ